MPTHYEEYAQREGDRQGSSGTFADSDLVRYILDLFDAFKMSRQPFELEWEECWYNFIGQYQANLNWKPASEGSSGRSRIFVKLTALKCNTAHAKVVDVLFPRGEMPFVLDNTTYAEIYQALGLNNEQVKAITERAEKKMKMHFKDIDMAEVMSAAILDLAVMGSAVLKGPIAEIIKTPLPMVRTFGGMPIDQLVPGANPIGHQMVEQIRPVVDHIPLWEYYVDANAKSPQESIGEMQFQRILPGKFIQFRNKPGFVEDNIDEAVRMAALDHDEDNTWRMLGDKYQGTQGEKDKKVPVLEYFGLIPVKYLRNIQKDGYEIDVPEELNDRESVEATAMIAADGVLVRADINYAKSRPYKFCPYKKRPHTIYGIGVASSMRDSQKIVNSAARMIIDNKALSGNTILAINSSRIDMRKTKDMSVYAGKTFYTKGQFAPKDAVDNIEIRDVTKGLQELMEMFIKFADEETGIPKITHGEQGSAFLNKTARGMSMLMGAANLGIKPVMKNIDDYWIEPIAESFYEFFTAVEDPAFPVPLRIKATGHENLMAKEIKIENLMNFMQLTSNPQDAIFTDRVKYIKMIAELMETEDVMKSDEEIQSILEELSTQAEKPKDLRERLQIEKLYLLLSRSEQVQILDQLGIEADPNYNYNLQELQKELVLIGAKAKENLKKPGGNGAKKDG